MKNNQKGFANLVLVGVIVIVVFIVGIFIVKILNNKYCLPLEKSFWCLFTPPIIN